MVEKQLASFLLTARQSLKHGQPQHAADLLQAALHLDSRNALALFLLGNAHAALGAHAAAAHAFRQAARLTGDAAPDSQRHQLHITATENLLLESGHALPAEWVAALHDAPRLAALERGIAAAVQCDPAGDSRVLVVGGMGLEAVMVAQAGAAAVAVYCPDNPLAASLVAELAAGSGCPHRVAAATSAAQLAQLGAQQAPAGYSALVLAGALGCSIGWQQLAGDLAAAAPLLAPGAKLLPHAVHMRGALVQCPGAVALNEVDVQAVQAGTGGLDLDATNRMLPRASRSVRLPTYPHTALTDSASLLTVPLSALLPTTTNSGADSCASSRDMLAAAVQLQVGTGGAADALCWWYEQVLADPASPTSSTAHNGAEGAGGSPLRLSADPAGCPGRDAQLRPHVWQHLQFLDHRQLAPGQAVEVLCRLAGPAASTTAAAARLQAVSLAGNNSQGSATGPLSLQFDVRLGGASSSEAKASLLLQVRHAAVAAAMPRYHTSMLNDSLRTQAYRQGIASTLQRAADRSAATAAAAGDAEAPVVLEIGSGSGLLCLLACQAGAPRVLGCERQPELLEVAGRLLEANGLAERVAILPKHSRALTVAAGAGGGRGGAADLPRRADVLLHEIFGTDPFSEGVVPTLLHAKQHQLQPGAALAPCKLHVVAAVAASASLHRLLRPPPAVCGGRVATGALRQLAPRKVDCLAGDSDLLLLTEPCRVLSVDFEDAELALAGSSTVLLECLLRPLPLAAWLAAQQAAAGQAAQQGATSRNGSVHQALQPEEGGVLEGCGLFAVAWFEYEFSGGIVGSTAPHMQRTEHWQQVVQPLEGAPADAALAGLAGGGSCDGGGGDVAGLLLTAGYRVDRLWFELEAVAAAVDGSEDDGEL